MDGKLNCLFHNKNKIWYMLCFFALGIIDQRRGSAVGAVQMAAANCVGLVIAAMLLPTVHLSSFQHKIYIWWTAAAVILGSGAVVWGWSHWPYHGQWLTGVLNVAVWGYYVIYLIRDGKNTEAVKRIKQPFFWCFCIMCLLMFFSRHEGILPLWTLLIFGGFYLIGIPKENREQFFQGMLNGIILWFFVQQTAAFAFRPYDVDARYCGMYATCSPNGIFYMIVFCAFLCKWVWAKNQKKNRFLIYFYFVMSAVSISFLLFTGGRSSLMGAAVAAFAVYCIYDIVLHKNFRRWLQHIALFCLCVGITFPMVYGAIRYFPTILHHPIWFYAEYDEDASIRSFDPWDSDRYISFEEAVDGTIGRMVDVFGIDITKLSLKASLGPLTLKVQAAEKDSPGTSPENPFTLSWTERDETGVSGRILIYACYLYHLNLWGHSGEEPSFYIGSGYRPAHAHDMFLQAAYDYGIPAGLLFLGLHLYAMVYFISYMIKGQNDSKWMCLPFFAAVFFYGLTELPTVQGTITWTFIYLLLCFAGEEGTKGGKRKCVNLKN